jgi:hypothetical protein
MLMNACRCLETAGLFMTTTYLRNPMIIHRFFPNMLHIEAHMLTLGAAPESVREDCKMQFSRRYARAYYVHTRRLGTDYHMGTMRNNGTSRQ